MDAKAAKRLPGEGVDLGDVRMFDNQDLFPHQERNLRAESWWMKEGNSMDSYIREIRRQADVSKKPYKNEKGFSAERQAELRKAIDDPKKSIYAVNDLRTLLQNQIQIAGFLMGTELSHLELPADVKLGEHLQLSGDPKENVRTTAKLAMELWQLPGDVNSFDAGRYENWIQRYPHLAAVKHIEQKLLDVWKHPDNYYDYIGYAGEQISLIDAAIAGIRGGSFDKAQEFWDANFHQGGGVPKPNEDSNHFLSVLRNHRDRAVAFRGWVNGATYSQKPIYGYRTT